MRDLRDIPNWRRPGYIVGRGVINYERAAPRGWYFIQLCENSGEQCYLSIQRDGATIGIDPTGREVPYLSLESYYPSRDNAVAAAAQHEGRARGGPEALGQALLQRRMRRRYERA